MNEQKRIIKEQGIIVDGINVEFVGKIYLFLKVVKSSFGDISCLVEVFVKMVKCTLSLGLLFCTKDLFKMYGVLNHLLNHPKCS